MSRAVTLPYQPRESVAVALCPEPELTATVPQSPSRLPESAVPPRPVTAVPVKSPVPLVSSARAVTFASICATVSSPPKSDSPVTCVLAVASAVAEATADALSEIAPLVITGAPDGYAIPPSVPAESAGAAT